MGKRTKEFYKMMDRFNAMLAQAQQPNQWEVALGNEITKRQNRSTGDIMADNLGTVADWQRRYQAGVTPESSVRNKGYKMQLGMARDLGAQELARDYGRMGEESVRNYRDQTLNLMGNQQQTASQRMFGALNAAGQGAQIWNSFKPKKSWWDTIIGGATDIVKLGRSITGSTQGG